VIPRDIIRLSTEGLWNAGIIAVEDRFLLIGNTQDRHTKWMDYLSSDLTPRNDPVNFRLTGGFDFRLFNIGSSIYTAYHTKDAAYRAAVAVENLGVTRTWDLRRSPTVYKSEHIEDWPGYKKVSPEKNWMPFDSGLCDREICLVYSVAPHRIVKLVLTTGKVHLAYMEPWSPLGGRPGLSGNTNAIPVGDFFMSAFHWKEDHAYWTSYYLFDRKPPYRPRRIAREPLWTPAMSVEEKRSSRVARCFKNVIFPVGLARQKDRILMSYGENDFIQKVAVFEETDLIAGTEPV
jgi:predicted GH43/DUF377 family glycosyl hydrolase